MHNITAMLLAAGLGTRMRPLTHTRPKPLIEVAGRSLIDRLLDNLVEAGIGRAIVNVHHCAEQIEAHMRHRTDIEIIISDERETLLDTGGAVVAARDLFAENHALIINTDAFWHGSPNNAFRDLIAQFDPQRMDYLLLVADRMRASGYRGRGDFFQDAQGRLTRRGQADHAPLVHGGSYILDPAILDEFELKPFSANQMWDRALAKQTLFGHRLDAYWMHVGDPQAIDEAERYLHEAQT